MNRLLRLAPWYRPEEIAAREARTEEVRRHAVKARMDAAPLLRAELDGAVDAFRRPQA